MRRRAIRLGAVVLLAVGAAMTANAEVVPVFTLDPVGGALSGSPGQTVGWGFTLFYGGPDYVVVTSSDYVTNTPLGTYTDIMSSQFYQVIGPLPDESPTWTLQFDSKGLTTGVGFYTISGSALPVTQSTGVIQLTYDLYSVSPHDLSFNPDTDTISSGNPISAPASIDVTGPVVATPEPPASEMLGVLIALVCGIAWCQIKWSDGTIRSSERGNGVPGVCLREELFELESTTYRDISSTRRL